MNLDVKRIIFKMGRALALLFVIVGCILLITSVPKDFDIRYFKGNYEATHSFRDILTLIKENFMRFIQGDLGQVQVNGILVQEIFRVSFLRSLAVLLPSLVISIVLGSFFGVMGGIASRKNTLSNTLSMIPMSMPDVFTIGLVQFFALTLFRNNMKFLGIGPIEHKGDGFWYSSIFPIMAISIIPLFYVMVTIIKTIETEQKKPYVLALRGKGLKRGYIIRVHMKKIMMYNVLSIMPSMLTMMFSSLIIVENLFFYRGLGYEMVNIFRSTRVTPLESQALFTYFLIMMAIVYFVFYGILNSIKSYALPDLHEEL